MLKIKNGKQQKRWETEGTATYTAGKAAGGLCLLLDSCTARDRGSCRPLGTYLGPPGAQPGLAAVKHPDPSTFTCSWVSLLTSHRCPEAPTRQVIHPRSLQGFLFQIDHPLTKKKVIRGLSFRRWDWCSVGKKDKLCRAVLSSCHSQQLCNTWWGTLIASDTY